MDQKKLEEFNTELKALLLKYNLVMKIDHTITVVDRKVAEAQNSEIIGDNVAKKEDK